MIKIAFEGPPGSGKSIAMSMVQAMLDANKIKYCVDEDTHLMDVNMKSFIKAEK